MFQLHMNRYRELSRIGPEVNSTISSWYRRNFIKDGKKDKEIRFPMCSKNTIFTTLY